MIVGPMAANGQEPVGSMGTDTPLAVLSDQPKLLFNYFKQLFAQVTNPPIDPLREGLVMSLLTFTGKQRNLLDETPEHCKQLELPHPILTNEDMQRLRTVKRSDFKVAVLPALFAYSEEEPGKHLAEALAELVDAAERAIQDGASLLIISDRDISPRHVAIPSLLATSALHHGLLGAAAAERSGHRRGKRRAPRSDALLPALRLRGQRHQSLHGLRGHLQAAGRRRPARQTSRSSTSSTTTSPR